MHVTAPPGKAPEVKMGGRRPEPEHPPKLDESVPSATSTTRQVALAPAAPAPRIRRRNRMITSCLECRRRKLKCDKSHPCANCVKSIRDCLFLAPALDSASQLKLTEIKEKMGSLERVLEQDVAKRVHRSRNSEGDELDFAPEPEDEKDLIITPLALRDNSYDENADDDLTDLGFMMGKMRLSERVGGYFRPKMADELSYTLKEQGSDSRLPGVKTEAIDQAALHVPTLSPHTIISPGPTYLAPSPSFFFPGGSSSLSLIDYLPSRTVADRLLNRYWLSVHPVSRVVHKPSFLRRYEAFWDDISRGLEPPYALQAVVFATMFSGAVSVPDAVISMEFGVSKQDLVHNFKLGTEAALGRANITRSTKVETLQAFVMYMIPLCRGEVSRSHSVLCGTAIRIAECMGLHRDGTAYEMGPVETHVRRMIWYALGCLDIRTCEAQGPRPVIRTDDFDTRFPLNVDDDELESPNPPTESAKRWTDVTLSLIRWECLEMHRLIWFDRLRLENKTLTLAAVLGKVENFRRMMKEKYLSLIDDSIPVQHYGRQLFEILSLRLHAVVLHRYHNGITFQGPDRLREILISSGIQVTEKCIELETSPRLKPWAWVNGAHQQYHYALLICMEIFANPNLPDADRIWACLDYVFEVPTHLTREQKGRWILTEVRDRSELFANSRKARAPAGYGDRIPQPTTSRSDELNDPSILRGGPRRLNAARADLAQNITAAEAMRNQYAPMQEAPGMHQGNYYQTPNVPTSQTAPLRDDRMVEIDWHEWDKLFPPLVNQPPHKNQRCGGRE